MPRASISASFDADLTQLAVAIMDGDQVQAAYTMRLSDAEREQIRSADATADEIAANIAARVAAILSP